MRSRESKSDTISIMLVCGLVYVTASSFHSVSIVSLCDPRFSAGAVTRISNNLLRLLALTNKKDERRALPQAGQLAICGMIPWS